MKNFFLFLFITAFLLGCKNSNSNSKTLNQNKLESENMADSSSTSDSTLIAIIKTNMGNIEIKLFENRTPKTVENFVGLAKKGYYKGVIFHRVIEEFMIQGGDPTGTGRGGESLWGKPFEDEFDSSLTFDQPGILAMANSGPNTNGSQFFITTVPTPWLTGKHTIFGKVINGMNVVNKIEQVPTSKPYNKPLEDVVMKEVVIEKRAAKEKND